MIVMKFGGSSLESAAAIQQAASIVRAQIERRPVVVVSAMGKTTQQLLSMGGEAVGGQKSQALQRLENLYNMHQSEILPLLSTSDNERAECIMAGCFGDLRELIHGLTIIGELTPRTADAIASYGERLSSELIALAFQNSGIESVHFDARRAILTDARYTQAAPLLDQTYENLQQMCVPLVQPNKVIVLGGFIGATESGVTTTLGRGGSDFTAAIVGAGLRAEEIQIWTDVDGVLTCDPKLVPDAHRVRTISFAEAAELAYFGAKVLHPATMLPAVEMDIPIVVMNSRRPEVPGTRIVANSVPCTNVIKAISCKTGISVVNIRSARMLMAHGFLRRIFEIFDRAETSVDLLASSEVSVSLTVDNPVRLDEIWEKLRQFSEVSVEENQAIICVVGDNIRNTPGVAARIFGAMPGVNVRMISQGASLLNFSFVVAAEDLRRTVGLLHDEFFRDPDPMVFD
jgi:aspartate kinase